MSSAQWLVTKELVKDDREMVFEDGISRFRPKHSKTLKSPSKAPIRGGPKSCRRHCGSSRSRCPDSGRGRTAR